MHNQIPTPELIEQARIDYAAIARTRVPSSQLTPGQKLERRIAFAPTADIRGVTLPLSEDKFLKDLAKLYGYSKEVFMGIEIHRLLILNPNNIQAGIDTLTDTSGSSKTVRTELVPDVFIPLAEHAMIHHVSSSVLARVALAQNYQI